MTDSKIQWTDKTWNPVRGCSRVSEGCRFCYAERQAARFSDPGQYAHGFVKRTENGPRWTGKVELVPDKLEEPVRWKKPCRVFVNSMSDLFHESLSDEAIVEVFSVMGCNRAQHHTFQILTKRPKRMREFARKWKNSDLPGVACGDDQYDHERSDYTWPLPNVWLGVSCEDQKTADERIPILLDTPAAVRFVSAEPLLGPIVFHRFNSDPTLGSPARKPDWIIVGGESGPGARRCELSWVRWIKEQCENAGVPVFIKQLGAQPFGYPETTHTLKGGAHDGATFRAECIYDPDKPQSRLAFRDRKGGEITEWPEDLRVREFPEGIAR